jgi:hypothetical protein
MQSKVREAQRPAFLDKILSVVSQKEDEELTIYKEFLKNSLEVVNRYKGKTLSFDWTIEIEHSDSVLNGSLCYIFYFYAKIHSPGQKNGSRFTTREAEEQARDSLSFFEVLLFCRDFRIIPRFLIRDEIMFLWKIMNIEKAQNGEPASKLIDLNHFKDLICRMAILAFNKPGMKKLIIQANGTMPTMIEQVNSFAMYLHLNDIDYVRNRIRTVGRETLGALNYRSQGETNVQTRINLRDDVKGKRLYKIMNNETTSFAKPNMHGSGQVRDFDIGNGNENDEIIDTPRTHQMLANIAGTIQSKVHGVYGSASISSRGVDGRESTTSKVDTQSGSRSVGSQLPVPKALQRTNVTTSSEQIALLTSIANRICNEKYDDAVQSEVKYAMESIDTDCDAKDEPLNLLNKSSSFKITDSQEKALLQYDPNVLVPLLTPYSDLTSYLTHKKSNTNSVTMSIVNTPFLDLGVQYNKQKCKIQLKILNFTHHDVFLNISTSSNIGNNNPITITTLPSAFAPGLSRNVFISFTIEKELNSNHMNVLSTIYVELVCSRNTHPSEIVICPVFYRIIDEDESTPSTSLHESNHLYPYCSNEKTLMSLCSKYNISITNISNNNSTQSRTADNNLRNTGTSNIDEAFVKLNVQDMNPTIDAFPLRSPLSPKRSDYNNNTIKRGNSAHI